MDFVVIFAGVLIILAIGVVMNAWLEKNELERKYLYELLKSEEKKNGKY